MVKCAARVLAVGIGIMGCAHAEEGALQADFRPRPPEMVKEEETGKFTGPLVDVLEEAAAAVGHRVVWRDAPFPRSLEDLKSGGTDYGAHDSTIINNTVFGNWAASNGDVNETWIGVFNGKDDTPPVNVVVRNNFSSVYGLADSGVTADHNVTAADPQGMFVKFDRANFQYDLHPASGSVELGFGSLQPAPAYDITGASRTSPITAGAYQ